MSVLSVAGFTNIGYHLHARDFDAERPDLRGRVALVTGSTGGIGRAALGDMGATVAESKSKGSITNSAVAAV